MALIHLIYVSTAPAQYSSVELDKLLETSVKRNQAAGLTGMLLYAGGSFMQVLEGDEDKVLETYARISRDTRHTNIIELERAPIEQREFDHWSMGFLRLNEQDAVAHPGYADMIRNGFTRHTVGARPGAAHEVLMSFWKTMRATA